MLPVPAQAMISRILADRPRPNGIAVNERWNLWGSGRDRRAWREDTAGYSPMAVVRPDLEAALVEAARDAGAMFWSAQRVPDLKRDDTWRVRAGPGAPTYTAPFLVDATGRHAPLARALGSRHVPLDTTIALAAVVPGRPRTTRVMTMESAAFGWAVSVPMPDGRRTVTLCTDGHARTGPLGTPRGWWAAARGCHMVAATISNPPPDHVGLRIAHASLRNPIVGDHWLAVGDAAASHTPLSTTGIERAVAGGLHAAKAIVASRRGEPDALDGYAEAVLRNWKAQRARDDALHRAESRFAAPGYWARRLNA